MKSKEVAKILNLSVAGYSRKENGHARFYADELAILSNLFEVPFEIFFEAACHNKTRNEEDRGVESGC